MSFYNRLSISLVADPYVPKNLDRARRHSAIIVGHPYGGVNYLASLRDRGMSYLLAEYDAVDLGLALDKIGTLLGVPPLMLGGGGALVPDRPPGR